MYSEYKLREEELMYAAIDWVGDKYDEINRIYAEEIPNERIRNTYIKTLAYAWGDNIKDTEINNEIDRCQFDWSIYYYIMDDKKKLVSCYHDEFFDPEMD